MPRYRWSDGYRQAWEFEAEDSEFATVALDTLVTARLESRRRGHDGATRRNYHLYPELQLHLQHGRSTWLLAATVPLMRLYENQPATAPAYDTAAWFAAVDKQRTWADKLDQFAGDVGRIVGDIMRRPDEWHV